MPVSLFYLLSAIMLGFALLVVVQRNPVASALSLVVSFLGLAGLYITLDAYFLGVVQVIVYAGAVMVLFLFIVMLFDIRAEELRKFNKIAVTGGIALAIGFTVALTGVLGAYDDGETKLKDVPLDSAAALEARRAAGISLPTIDNDLAAGEVPDAKLMGESLFTRYHFHLQVVGVLLLCATAGVVVLSRREDRTGTGDPPP